MTDFLKKLLNQYPIEAFQSLGLPEYALPKAYPAPLRGNLSFEEVAKRWMGNALLLRYSELPVPVGARFALLAEVGDPTQEIVASLLKKALPYTHIEVVTPPYLPRRLSEADLVLSISDYAEGLHPLDRGLLIHSDLFPHDLPKSDPYYFAHLSTESDYSSYLKALLERTHGDLKLIITRPFKAPSIKGRRLVTEVRTNLSHLERQRLILGSENFVGCGDIRSLTDALAHDKEVFYPTPLPPSLKTSHLLNPNLINFIKSRFYPSLKEAEESRFKEFLEGAHSLQDIVLWKN